MNRKYTEETIKNIVNYINSKFDKAFIGCDIIVGFPNETKEDFEITYNNLQKLNLTRIHVFPYSRRKGTIADKMQNQIDENEKKQRVSLIQTLSNNKLENFLLNNLNTENEVIIEKQRDKKTNLLKGITKNYINVLIDNKDEYKDKLVKVKLTSLSDSKEKIIAKIV